MQSSHCSSMDFSNYILKILCFIFRDLKPENILLDYKVCILIL